jgi:iron complex outermembrane receptor protein
VDGRFTASIDGSNYLPFIPAPKLQTECRADIKKINNYIKNSYFKLTVENYFTQNKAFTSYNTETVTKGYSLLNVAFGLDFLNKKHQLLFTLNFSASNIMDVAYQNHLSRLKYAAENLQTNRQGVFNVGRNFGIKLNVPLNFTFK